MPRREVRGDGARPPASAARAILAAALALCSGCGREELLHGLEQGQANRVLVALDEEGLRASSRCERGEGGGCTVQVRPRDASRARRLLLERELPRTAPAGFAEVFGQGGVVPSASEERALYLAALSGELARTVEGVPGVLSARVHLALPPPDPLSPGPATPSRASLLVRARPGQRARLSALAPELQAVVAGAVPALEASSVTVVVTEALEVVGSSARPALPSPEEAPAAPAIGARPSGALRAIGGGRVAATSLAAAGALAVGALVLAGPRRLWRPGLGSRRPSATKDP